MSLCVILTSISACRPLPDVQATADAAVDGTLTAESSVDKGMVAPSATVPDSVPVVGNGPTLAGCPIFPSDHIWNTRIDTLPVDPHSDDYMRSMGHDTTLHPDFGSGEWDGGPIGIPYTVTSSGAVSPAVISFYYPDDSDPGTYFIPPDPQIEGGPNADGDRHILLIDTAICTLSEIYDAYPDGAGWEAGSGAVWDLNGYELRPEEWTSADAAGLPILPGLVRYEEIAAGEIRHAIRFTVEETQQAYIWPARHHASDITDPSVPPMGQRFRLRADFDVTIYPHDVQVILIAMQRYGLMLADNGSDWFISGAPDPRWNDEELVEAFNTIQGSDFEAVDVSSLMIDPDSGQAHQP